MHLYLYKILGLTDDEGALRGSAFFSDLRGVQEFQEKFEVLGEDTYEYTIKIQLFMIFSGLWKALRIISFIKQLLFLEINHHVIQRLIWSFHACWQVLSWSVFSTWTLCLSGFCRNCAFAMFWLGFWHRLFIFFRNESVTVKANILPPLECLYPIN